MPATALKSGGLGVKAMKTVAATLELDADEAARLVELAHIAGLVASTTTSRKEGRRYVQDTVVGPTPAAAAWVERPLDRRGAQLATAWLRAEHWPSASGRAASDRDRKPAPVLSHQYGDTAPARRRDVLEMLGTLEVTQSTSPVALEACVYWQRPHPWLQVDDVTPSEAIGWVYAEAELLGVVAAGALSSFGRALAGGDAAGAERALEAALPAPARTFTLQTDLTATVVGDLDRDTLVELRLLADVESTGAATTLRFSDASVRRAIDAGRDRDTILAFLEAHAAKGVPPALAYLVNDVARRHGHLVVGAAGAFVTSDDAAVLADACSHRRTRKLALRLLAPTVAVSPRAPDAVLDGLRAAGFLPVADGEAPGEITLAKATAAPSSGRATGTTTPGGATGDRLPEPFRARPGPGRPSVPALDDAAASALAEQIVAGWVDAAPTTPREPFLPFPHGDPYAADDFDAMFDGDDILEVESLDEVLASAAESSSVVAIALGSGDKLAGPILLAVDEWEPGRVAGVDLSDGAPTSILTEHIGAALELGLASDLLPPEPRRAGRRPTSGRRRR